MSYKVRPAQPEDMPYLMLLQMQCGQKKASGNVERQSAHGDENQWLRTAMLTLVCEEEGVLKGFIAVTIVPPLPLIGLVAPIWTITNLCVPEENTEVASLLIQEVSHRASESNGRVDVVW